MDGKAVAWVAYLPLPGLGLVPAWAAPHDPLARYHARQGGLLVALLYLLLLAVGFMAQTASAAKDALAIVAAPVLLLGLAGSAYGVWGALRARYVRVRPVWDLCSAIWS